MKFINQSHTIISYPENTLVETERIARTCYKSEDKITSGSAEKLVKSLIGRGHHSMLEFGDITVRFITNRGVTHELVRHRLCSFAQESTRYVKYDGDMEIIRPVWWDTSTDIQKEIFVSLCEEAEKSYHKLLDEGWQPQQAREVLPNALKTEIVVKANIREWRHIFSERTPKAAHPQMRALMIPLLAELQEKVPLMFDSLPKH